MKPRIFCFQNEYHVLLNNCIRFKNQVLEELKKYEMKDAEVKVPVGSGYEKCVEDPADDAKLLSELEEAFKDLEDRA